MTQSIDDLLMGKYPLRPSLIVVGEGNVGRGEALSQPGDLLVVNRQIADIGDAMHVAHIDALRWPDSLPGECHQHYATHEVAGCQQPLTKQLTLDGTLNTRLGNQPRRSQPQTHHDHRLDANPHPQAFLVHQ